MRNQDKQMAYLILRVTLGLNLSVHGVIRLGENYHKFIAWTASQFEKSPLPSWGVSLLSHTLPVLELGIGVLLILGFLTRLTTILGSLVMMSLIFGMAVLQNWEIVGVQMIYVLFYFLILFLREYNYYSLDHVVQKREASNE
jgi:thiosulfate dehydrogenase [quinone] large subunit